MQLPIETVTRIVQLTKARMAANLIAKEVGCSKNTVFNVRARYGLRGERWVARTELSTEETAAAVIAYRSGARLVDVATEYRIGIRILRGILVSCGVSIRVHTHPQETIDKVRELYVNSSLLMREIGAECGVHQSTVTEMVKGLTRLNPPVIPNPMEGRYFYGVWVERYGQAEADRKMAIVKAQMSQRSTGKNNPMYGRPSPQGAGNGWKGRYKGHYFRSLREASFMLLCERDRRPWKTGETVSIPYTLNGSARTYRPDFLCGTTMIELKPTRLIYSPAVAAKTKAAEAYCKQHGLTYEIYDCGVEGDLIQHAWEAGLVVFAKGYEERFVAYLTGQ